MSKRTDRPVGRRSRYVESTIKEVLYGISLGLTNKDAALAAGVSEDTFYRWEREKPNFSSRVEQAKAARVRLLMRQLTTAAAQRDIRAIGELLDRTTTDYRRVTKTDMSHIFGGKVTHDHTGEVKATIDLSLLSDDELRMMRAFKEKVTILEIEP